MALSTAFSPFVPAAADFSSPYEQLDPPPELRRALILQHGDSTLGYEYMRRFV